MSDELRPLSLLAQTDQEKYLLREPCLELRAGHQQGCFNKTLITKPGGGTNLAHKSGWQTLTLD